MSEIDQDAINKLSQSVDEFKTANLKEMAEIREYIIELKCRKYCEAHETMISKIDVFVSTVTEWMKSTQEYRIKQGEKIDHILEFMSKLPCEKRVGWWESMNKQMAFMWGIIFLMVTYLMTMGIKAVFAK
jgi:hypothetical protein